MKRRSSLGASKRRLLIGIGLLILITLKEVKGIRWLSLLKTASIISQDWDKVCSTVEGLSKRQVRICKKNVEVMDSVRVGGGRAIRECQFQFRFRRWNCNTVNESKVFGKALDDGTREAAFVHAITAAGVAHSVTRACSSGQLQRCGCDRTIRGISADGFEWSGCSDNVAFGTAFSKQFVDARDARAARGRSSPRSLMNLHNNEAGRTVVESNMRVECKCHGVSGSCEMKTCWRAMPSFREVGAILKEKFDSATEVKALKMDKHLIYLDSSPDFCDSDDRTGSLGTTGRSCNRTSKAIDGCELLCCGRGFNTRIEKITERCMCKFHWCCYVKCRECQRDLEINTCQ